MMDLLTLIVDFILHVDIHLQALMNNYGLWVYAILFLIIFCETGLVVTPFLPGDSLLFAAGALTVGSALDVNLLAGTNTTIGVVATDAQITKPQAQRLATVAHDGLARAINPVHTMSDGDTLFALGTGQSGRTLGLMTLFTLAAEAVALATARAILLAQSASRALRKKT